ncbi:hypothetical protein [Lysinibacillus cavernae]|uniref:hypothetical protein n=1 Tax=Lysinibacillus cavernae TaxID=2666135 RepID=UPI0018C32736|nr:hypothetical protein [Lysinibacillus cavernae]
MKIIHTIVGMVIILIGIAFISTTIFDAPVRNVMLKVYGGIIVFVGTFYLKKIAKFGK